MYSKNVHKKATRAMTIMIYCQKTYTKSDLHLFYRTSRYSQHYFLNEYMYFIFFGDDHFPGLKALSNYLCIMVTYIMKMVSHFVSMK